ncbi:TOMM precursor leader peptide-binding protein [Actinophytocola gossypii]|uniref:TOMM leader peptide-binding protein n=1 Tax=Actinophytocola gossypii TaxID=2812003 RepID=A0ABT2J2A0_9PSEU|nr:TOMM precursor leader peptide-binding protein [Actinophytocola gossypii]MCT2581985.1 TOMM precursor leader peptide-binding protein [Actinophytocola gossypii]
MTGTEIGSGLGPELVGFKRHLRAEVGNGVTYLFSERGMTTLRGAEVSALTPLLDGTRSMDELLDVAEDLPREKVEAVVAQLNEAGLLSLRKPDVELTADEPTLAYWDTVGLDAVEAVSGTVTKSIAVFTVGEVDTVSAWSAFRAAGLAVTAGLPLDPAHLDVDLPVVLCDDYLNPCLGEMSEALRVAGIPWLLAKPAGAQVWIGPFFEPATTGCWYCLANRLQQHRLAESCAVDELGRPGPIQAPIASVSPLAGAAMDLVVLEATKWLAGQRYVGQRSVWVMDSVDLSSRHHELRGRPQCEHCGDPDLVRHQARRPVVLGSRPKAPGGSHRAMTPEETLARYRHLVSPVAGVVKEIHRDRRGPALFNSYRSGQNAAQGTRSLDTLRATLRMENGGKGVTALEAEVGALCEAVERYSGTYQGDEQRIRGSLRSLGDSAIDPSTCQLFHDRQYRDRTGWNTTHSAFQHVCDPFDDEAELDWTPVWSMTGQTHRLLPTGMLYFGTPVESGPRFVQADSNGNAAGSSLEDATLQAMLELVERDAVALWWYNRTPMPGIDLGAFRDPWVDEVLAAYAGVGRAVWVLDVTSDLGIPAMAAVSGRTDGEREDIMFGFGAHLDPRVALRRALTELNQLMPAMVAKGDGDRYECDDPDAVRWWREATVANQPYLLPDPAVPARTPADWSRPPSADLYDDVRRVHDAIAGQGMEVLVLDQTRPDVGLPVVKVVVPGMRHFWARFGPGRLYDVPVRLGRLTEPTPYTELNPYPMFM